MSSIDELALIQSLARPEAFPGAVANVEVHQTHISAVFLGGETAFKIKKPVNLGFLDFSTLERRRHFCDEEVRINRRLAPRVYQGVVPVVATPTGFAFEGAGPAVEWAVKMERLPEELNLERRLERNEVDAAVLTSLAIRIAGFHRQSASTDEIARQARWRVVADNAITNVLAARWRVGRSLSPAVHDRLRMRTRRTLDELRPLIEARAQNGVPRDTHGDLRVDHVYWFPGRPAPDDWVILDGIEFNERFRYADPVADVAFLVMDLAFHGRWDLARSFAADYFAAAGDPDGQRLLPLYASYRAAVRGKVEGILLGESEVPDEERSAAVQRSMAHWLAALVWLEPPTTRPQIVMVAGLPGSGKSTLARALAERTQATILRSDTIRKELAGLAETATAAARFGEGIYSDAWNAKTYAELVRRAAALLWNGGQVIVDASFRRDVDRRTFVDLAKRWGVPVSYLHCRVDSNVARDRLHVRRGDASDADYSIFEAAAERWEPTSPAIARIERSLDANRPVAGVLQSALATLES